LLFVFYKLLVKLILHATNYRCLAKMLIFFCLERIISNSPNV
jgi:hypothetical protein